MVDGAAAFAAFDPSPSDGWFDTEVGHVAIGGERVAFSPGINTGAFHGWSQRRLAVGPVLATESITFVGLHRAAEAEYWLNATRTRGVVSWDVATGPALLLYPDEMGSGVHAGAYFLGEEAAVGAGIEKSLTTQRDTLGWFLPDNTFAGGRALWSCTRDSVACESWPPSVMGAQKVVSKGPTDWRFTIDALVEWDNPSLALGVVEFPDDTYLAD